jgi:haloalkane dehalogenase
MGSAHAQSATTARLSAPSIEEQPMDGYRTVVVEGARIAYVVRGEGRPIVFIHGNPSSSYLWRNMIPGLEGQGRTIALDLAGMGKSEPARNGYRFADHARRLDAFVNRLGLRDIVFVAHDWGAALAFDYSQRHPNNVHGVAFMEGVLPPAFPQPSFEAMGPEMGGMFRAFKDPVQGRQMVIEQNVFIEGILPQFVSAGQERQIVGRVDEGAADAVEITEDGRVHDGAREDPGRNLAQRERPHARSNVGRRMALVERRLRMNPG